MHEEKTRRGFLASTAMLAALTLQRSAEAFDDPLWTTKPFTPEGSFTPGVEGPASGPDGAVYAVNFGKQQTIGRITPDGVGEAWVTLPGKGVGNGIVFDQKGMMYVAEYVEHHVYRIHPATRKLEVYCHEPKMNQPNDLAIAPNGVLYASDPNWKAGTGQIWKIGLDGKATVVLPNRGTTNGIDVSPDGKTLYFNESVQRGVWSAPIKSDGSLGPIALVRQFPDFGFDGMRCDVDGNLYVTRHSKGTVIKLTPKGQILKEVDVLGTRPSNLCFGGPDGRTVYVTEVDHGRLVQFRVDRPGLAWKQNHR